MADKEEEDYTESDIVLADHQYPKFVKEGSKLIFEFGPKPSEAQTFVVKDDDAGNLEFCTTKKKTVLYAVTFADGIDKVKLDRYVGPLPLHTG